MKAYLLPLAPDINGITLNSGEKIIVGRNTTASHYILSKNVSKEHLSLQQDEDENWTVEDLQSLNGTFINDVKIDPFTKIKLEEGDIVDIVKPYKYKFTKDSGIINKIFEESLQMPISNIVDKLPQLRRLPIQSNKAAKVPTTDEDGIEPPLLKKSRINNIKDVSGTCKLTLGSPIKNKNAFIQSDKTYPPTMLLKNKLTNQLKSEIIAKDELVSILRMDFKMKKDKWEKEKIEQEDNLKIAYNAKLKAKEVQIEELLERQIGMTAQIQNVQAVEKSLRHQIDKLNKHQKLLSSTIERQDRELAELKMSKESLQLELAKFEVERIELLKNFEHSFGAENKLAEQKAELIRQLTVTLESEFQCVICQDLLVKATVMNCGHIFCKVCLETWLQTKKQCPVCRKHYQQKYHLLLLDNYLDAFVDKYGSEECKIKRDELKAQREQRAATTSAMEQQRNSSASSTRARNAASSVRGSFRRLWDLRNEINANARLLGNPGSSNRNRRRQRSIHFGLDTMIDSALAQMGRVNENGASNQYYDISEMLNRYVDEPDSGAGAIGRRSTRASGRNNRNTQPYRLRSSGRTNSDAADVITISDTTGPSNTTNFDAPISSVNPAPRPRARSNARASNDPDSVIYVFENGESFSTDFSASDTAESISAPRVTRRRTRGGHLIPPRRGTLSEADDIMTNVTTTDDDDEEEVIHLGGESTAFEDSDDDDADDDFGSHSNRRRGDRRDSDVSVEPVATATESTNPVAPTPSSSTNQRRAVTCTAICPRCHCRGHISRHCPQNRDL